MKKYLQTAVDSVLAGALIGVGTAVYLNCSNRIVGAFLFSVGLLTILLFRFKLYTGVVGTVTSPRQIPNLLLVFAGNFVGSAFTALIPTTGAEAVWQGKMEKGLWQAFVQGIVCGILIYVAVIAYRTYRDAAGTIVVVMAVATFILCGAEHSIADLCFAFAAKKASWHAVLFILVVAVGNAIGSLVPGLWTYYRDKKTEEN